VKVIDYSAICKDKRYKGKFIAVKEDRGKVEVISVDNDPQNVLKEAKKKGYKKPIITRVPIKDTSYVFYSS
jgi:hypothetical protein